MNPFVYRSKGEGKDVTPEVVELARHQIDQQEEIDRLVGWIEKNKQDIRDLRADILARTKRIQELEMQVRRESKDMTLAAAMLSDLLSDLLPAEKERTKAVLATLFARIQSIEDALDCLEERTACNG